MFKLSVITDEVSQDLQTAVNLAKEFNLDGIEIRSVWEKDPQNLDESDIRRIREIVTRNKLQVSCIASPFFKCDLDNPKEYDQHIEILEKCVRLAKELDTNIIRGFAFWRKGKLEDYLDRIIDQYQKPLGIIEKEKVILGVENEASTSLGNGRELKLFLDRIESPNVKVVWDPGNNISTWTLAEKGEIPYPDGYELIKDKIVHVHIKDLCLNPDTGKGEAVPLGTGEVDYPGQFRALIRDNYNGYVSLETHYRPKVRLDEDIVQRPVGSAFSADGEAGSRECLENLRRMLKEL